MAEGDKSTAATPVIDKKDRVRKRVDSTGGEENAAKKARTNEASASLANPSSSSSTTASVSASTASSSTRYDISSQDSSLTRVASSASTPLRLDLDKVPQRFTGSLSTSLSRRPSMSSISRPQTPLMRTASASSVFCSSSLEDDIAPRADLRKRLVRSASSTSLRSMSPTNSIMERVEPVFATESARKHMRNPRFIVDYSPPIVTQPQPDPEPAATFAEILPPPGYIPPPIPEVHPRDLPAFVRPQILSCSANGILFFTRANRLHFKNMAANEEVGQVWKLPEKYGSFTAIACSGAAVNTANVVAVGTSKGTVSIFDVQTKKRVMHWATKPVSALTWNNGILTVGCVTGLIIHFDTRITPLDKMKEQAQAVTRHQSPITRMEWNTAGDLLATGDRKGNVYCWRSGDKVPLDVGEFVMRRKKIKHASAISAVSWCPWQPKNLATADIKGVMHFWTVEPKNKDTNAMTPARFDTGYSITGLHWSTQCKEILTTHGYKPPENPGSQAPPPSPLAGPLAAPGPTPPSHNVENKLAVWQFPSLQLSNSQKMNTTDVPIGNSVMFAKGQKVVFGVPDQGKIYNCEVWGKKKPEMKIRRHSSLDYVGCIR